MGLGDMDKPSDRETETDRGSLYDGGLTVVEVLLVEGGSSSLVVGSGVGVGVGVFLVVVLVGLGGSGVGVGSGVSLPSTKCHSP